MSRIVLLFVVFLLIGCSAHETIQTASSLEEGGELIPPSEPHFSFSPSTAREAMHSSIAAQVADSVLYRSDTTRSINKTLQVVEGDSLENQQLYISQKLEEARQHYLAALTAQESGDSTRGAIEFESAITALNELSYLPDIDSNKDFADLSQNVIDDYEKHITSIDNLGPGASVFALREKLSQIIEKVDVSKLVFPDGEIEGMAVPLPLNEHVERNIAFFMSERGRVHFEKWMELSGKFFPVMRRIFREEGAPEELVYLSMIESGLRPDARSWAKAVGLWQFMKGTGALYGLRGNWWYDERRDFEKSTRAAARHLKDLFAEFGDWHVVLAAYNSGVGRVYGAIRRSGSTDYWKMRSHLPRQTRNYVPEYVAVARMAMAPEQYGFEGISLRDSLVYDLVTINDCADLRVLARCAETEVATLRELNPELLQVCTPPGVTGYRLRIPIGTADLFAANYAKVPDEQKRDWAVHTVRNGETISTIARRYGLATQLLVEVNNVKNTKKLTVGSQLAIPLPRDMMAAKAKIPFNYDPQVKGIDFGQLKAYVERRQSSPSSLASAKNVKSPSAKERLVYRVKRGDTIGYIAEWYAVRASDIRNWNDIAYGSTLMVNQEIVLWVTPAKASALRRVNEMSFAEKQSLRQEQLVQAGLFSGFSSSGKSRKSNGWVQYTVRSGDTLEKIATEHGISVGDLKMWNSLRSSKILVGQRLDIYSEPEERTKVVPTSPRSQYAGVPSQAENKSSISGSAITHHRVKQGETLWQIAKMYGVSVKELEELNDVRGVLKAGDRLILPQR